MPAALLVIGALTVTVGAFAISWQTGVVAVGALMMLVGADEARR